MNHKSKLSIGIKEDSLALEGEEFQLKQFIEKVVKYKQNEEINLFSCMNSSYIAGLLTSKRLEELEKKFSDKKIKQITILDLVLVFLHTFEHAQEETLYLTIGIVDFFRSISETCHSTATISFKDISSAVCDKAGEQFENEYEVPTKQYPPLRKFSFQKSTNNINKKIKSLPDCKPPLIYDNNQHSQIRRLQKGKFHSDSSSHNNNSIKQAIFAKEINKLLVIDSLDYRISLFDLEAVKTKTINAKGRGEKGVIIFAIAWSEKQQRVGAALMNYQLSFWDASTDFKFEKNFQVIEYCREYQNNIWYLEKHDMWITTDSHQHIYSWDLQQECTKFSMSSPQITSTIFKITEIPAFDLCIVGSSDKKVTIWNFYKQVMLFCVEVSKVGFHSLFYLNSFQILITAGYENHLSLFKIQDQILDCTLVGQLRGHTSMISCMEAIEGSPIIISADDQGIIKLWDIRSQNCIQTYEFGSGASSLSSSGITRSQINILLDMSIEGVLGIIGSRINLINFEENDDWDQKKNNKLVASEYPLKVEVNYEKEEIIICTRNLLKFYDISTGRCKYFFQGMMENNMDEITAFKQLDAGQIFLLGNSKGQISIHDKKFKGERGRMLFGHLNEITQIKVDYLNKLIITASWDSFIKIQRISLDSTANPPEMKRIIANANNSKIYLLFQKGVNLLEVSVYHNLMFSSSTNSQKVFVYDYEYCKLLNYIQFGSNVEPTALSIISGFPVLFVATSDNILYCIHFAKSENTTIFQLLCVLSLEETINEYDFVQNTNPSSHFITKMQENQQVIKQNQQFNDQKSSPSQKQPKSRSPQKNQDEFVFKNQENIILKHDMTYVTKFSTDFIFTPQEKLKQAHLYCATSKGKIIKIDFEKLFQYHSQIPFEQHANTRSNYNPFRNCEEDFQLVITKFTWVPGIFTPKSKITSSFSETKKELVEKEYLKLTEKMIVKQIQAHKEFINSIIAVTGENNHIISSSHDQYIRMWKKENLEMVCSLDINHPLPVLWDYKIDEVVKSSKKIMFAVRILDIINKKQRQEMNINQVNSTQILSFLKKLMGIEKHVQSDMNVPKKSEDQEYYLELQNKEKLDKEVMIMSQYYSPLDIKFEEVKHIYKNDLIGPSLKTMEISKRVAIAQKIWKANPKKQKEEQKYEADFAKYLERHKKEDENNLFLQFLEPSFRQRILKNKKEDKSHFSQQLAQRLDERIIKKEQTQNIPSPLMNALTRHSIKSEISSIAQIEVEQDQTKESYSLKKNLQRGHTKQNSMETGSLTNFGGHTLSVERRQYGQKDQVKEPLNFDQILKKPVAAPSPKKYVAIPDFEYTKVRVDIFPQTAAKIKQMGGKVYSSNNNSLSYAPILTPKQQSTQNSPRDTKFLDQNSDFGKTQDVFSYAKEKQLMSQNNNINSTLQTRGESITSQCSYTSQVQSASALQIHDVLSGLNAKLNRSKHGNFFSLHLPTQDFDTSEKNELEIMIKTNRSSCQPNSKTQASTHSNNTNTERLSKRIIETLPSPQNEDNIQLISNNISPSFSSHVHSSSLNATQKIFSQKTASKNSNLAQVTQASPFFASSKIQNKFSDLTTVAGIGGKEASGKKQQITEYTKKNKSSLPCLQTQTKF